MHRVNKALERMKSAGLRTAYVTLPENIRYLTGFTGEGGVFLSEAGAVIITDFRYVEQASRQSPGIECLRTTPETREAELLDGLLARAGSKRLAVEKGQLTVARLEELSAKLPGIEFPSLSEIPESLRKIKDEHEISCIIRASEIACRAFEELLGRIRPGMTEKEIQLDLDYTMLRGGSEKLAFDTIACAGVNGSLPHAVPSDHPVAKGELLTLDFGAQVSGYKCDITRTIAVGKPSPELRAVYDAVLKAQLMALSIIEPGVACKDVDKAARDMLEMAYPGAFGHSLGHGVGLMIHEGPNFSVRSNETLESGHVMTVEPGVYIPGLGGCRIEDTVIVRPGGLINAITAPKELIIL